MPPHLEFIGESRPLMHPGRHRRRDRNARKRHRRRRPWDRRKPIIAARPLDEHGRAVDIEAASPRAQHRFLSSCKCRRGANSTLKVDTRPMPSLKYFNHLIADADSDIGARFGVSFAGHRA